MSYCYVSFDDAFEFYSKKVYHYAVSQGWWAEERNKAEAIALMHSELSECLEAIRKPATKSKLKNFTAEEEELADVILRIMDYSYGFGLNVGAAVQAKHSYNLEREFSEEGKLF